MKDEHGSTQCLEIRAESVDCVGTRVQVSHIHDRDPVGEQRKEKDTSDCKFSGLPLLPVCMQSTPSRVFFSFTCRDLIAARVSIGLRPEFSASAMGTESSASANARMAYCSRPGLYAEQFCQLGDLYLSGQPQALPQPRTLTAASSTANEQAISAAPPP